MTDTCHLKFEKASQDEQKHLSLKLFAKCIKYSSREIEHWFQIAKLTA